MNFDRLIDAAMRDFARQDAAIAFDAVLALVDDYAERGASKPPGLRLFYLQGLPGALGCAIEDGRLTDVPALIGARR